MNQPWTVARKTCVVTGGNSGIGLETVIGLARQGARVALVSRDRARGEAALADARARPGTDAGSIELVVGDLGSLATIRALAAELLERFAELHVLVNNAGLWMPERVLTEDGLETTFAVNHLGPFLLTNLLLERLVASAPARIVNVSSEGHRQGKLRFDDLQAEQGFGKIRAYADSKLCNVLFTRELARRLKGTGVTANSLHPGVVNTNLVSDFGGLLGWAANTLGPIFLTTPEKGARTSLHVAAAPELEGVSGEYFKSEKRSRASRAGRDDVAARLLWEVSEELAGLTVPA